MHISWDILYLRDGRHVSIGFKQKGGLCFNRCRYVCLLANVSVSTITPLLKTWQRMLLNHSGYLRKKEGKIDSTRVFGITVWIHAFLFFEWPLARHLKYFHFWSWKWLNNGFMGAYGFKYYRNSQLYCLFSYDLCITRSLTRNLMSKRNIFALCVMYEDTNRKVKEYQPFNCPDMYVFCPNT